MRKIFFVLWAITLLSLFRLNGIAVADSYFGYETYGGTWHDADKTVANTDDDLMCWAATTANILTYTGWGFPQNEELSGTDEIFGYFQDHWTDDGGNMYYGLDWWFDGINDSQGDSWSSVGWAQVDADGGGFYAGTSFEDYYLFSGSDYCALDNIEYLLESGYGVGLSLAGRSGHAVTAWGYEYDDLGNYSGIYITDSDDGVEDLMYYQVTRNLDKWYLQNYYGTEDYFITEVQGLQIMDGSYPVPEPAALILFATGLAGLAGIGLRKRAGLKRNHFFIRCC